MEKDTIKRMLRITEGSNWHMTDSYLRDTWDINSQYVHINRFKKKPLRKRKYGLRKKHFTRYESHRKRGVEYLPF